MEISPAQWDRIPKSVKDYIRSLEQELERTKGDLERFRGEEKSPISISLSSNHTRMHIPDGTVYIDMTSENGIRKEVYMHKDLYDPSMLQLFGSDSLIVCPNSSNLLHIRVGRLEG